VGSPVLGEIFLCWVERTGESTSLRLDLWQGMRNQRGQGRVAAMEKRKKPPPGWRAFLSRNRIFLAPRRGRFVGQKLNPGKGEEEDEKDLHSRLGPTTCMNTFQEFRWTKKAGGRKKNYFRKPCKKKPPTRTPARVTFNRKILRWGKRHAAQVIFPPAQMQVGRREKSAEKRGHGLPGCGRGGREKMACSRGKGTRPVAERRPKRAFALGRWGQPGVEKKSVGSGHQAANPLCRPPPGSGALEGMIGG